MQRIGDSVHGKIFPSFYASNWFIHISFHFHLHVLDFPKRFKDIFQEVYENQWKSKFDAAGIWYVFFFSLMCGGCFVHPIILT